MIIFFILLILIILLIYSEHIAKNKNKPFVKNPIHTKIIQKEPIHKEKEQFTNFVSTVNLGICSRSLSENMNKLNGHRVINPFNNCQKNFSWDNYFNSAKFKQLPLNQVYPF
jgi:hypothetical protein